MNTNIRLTNTTALTATLESVQKRCTARTLSVTDIIGICESVENHIGISKKALQGVHFTFTGAEHFPNAYKYRPESTHFEAEYRSGNWTITAIGRYTCPNERKQVRITLTETAKEAVIDRMSAF